VVMTNKMVRYGIASRQQTVTLTTDISQNIQLMTFSRVKSQFAQETADQKATKIFTNHY